MSVVRIKAAVIDTKKLLLYKEDGSTISIQQGDPRLKTLVDAVMPIIKLGGIAEIDLMIVNQYKEFEQAQEQPRVSFFRAAKARLGRLFKTQEDTEIQPGVFGEIPVADNLDEAIEEIIAHAEPVTNPEFSPADTQADQTIIAVVEDDQGARKIIPGVESLQNILEHSAKNRNTVGVQNLLKRMANYVTERQHSVEDLLRFLEKGDLPIADDGSIIAYKRLYSRTEDGETYFVDPHTHKVRQKVGSKVFVNEKLVDKSRRNECSNGLHIGRRAYMGSFSGDVMVLCKIAPEDVIVVPHNDPNKVRVCAYHILARLPDQAFKQICRNKPMTEIDGLSELLGKVLKGNHIDVLETVEITEQEGGGLVITPTGAVRAKGANRKKDGHTKAVAIDDKRSKLAAQEPPSTVDVVEVAKAVQGSRQARAQELWQIIETSKDQLHVYQAAVDLMVFKKRTKISWDRLGLTKEQVAKVLNIAETPVSASSPTSKAKTPKKASKASSKAPRPSNSAKPGETPFAEKPIQKPEPVPASKPLSKYQQLRQLADQLDTGHLSPAQEAGVAQKLLDARKASKKSWEALNLPDLSDLQLRRIIESPLAAQAPASVPAPAPKNDPTEMSLPSDKKAALAQVRSGKTVSAASKETGVSRRTIDRLIDKYGK